MDHATPLPHFAASSVATPITGLRRRLVQAFFWLEAVFRTLRERRELMALDDRSLKDIGVSRADADREWARPFWDVPRGP